MVARRRARREVRHRSHPWHGDWRWHRHRRGDLPRRDRRRGGIRTRHDRCQWTPLQVRQLRLHRGVRVRAGDRGACDRRYPVGHRDVPARVREGRPHQDHGADRVRSRQRRRRMGAGSRARDRVAAGRRRGELHQYLQPRSRRDLRRRHPGRGQAVPAAAQRGQAARLQAGLGSVQDRSGNAARYCRRVRRGRRLHPKPLGTALKRLGVIGSMVWDTIHGRDPAQAAVQEWGGISYALAALDATLRDDWEIVPVIKVGRDLAPNANAFLRTLRRTTHHARFLEVPEPNHRVTLRYESLERRCEQMTGGVPPWTWPQLGPLVRDLDPLYVDFISGFEMNLETARLLRRGFPRFMYADLHSLFLGKEADGMRVPRALPQAPAWFGCFDVIQLNEDEMSQLGSDPLAIAADALRQGCSTLCVTLGGRGAAYLTGEPIRTARISAPAIHPPAFAQENDPTGCGDVFGGTVAAALLRR